jgi:hypothetical protein
MNLSNLLWSWSWNIPNLELVEAMSKFYFYMFLLFYLVSSSRSWLQVVAILEVGLSRMGNGSTKKMMINK